MPRAVVVAPYAGQAYAKCEFNVPVSVKHESIAIVETGGEHVAFVAVRTELDVVDTSGHRHAHKVTGHRAVEPIATPILNVRRCDSRASSERFGEMRIQSSVLVFKATRCATAGSVRNKSAMNVNNG